MVTHDPVRVTEEGAYYNKPKMTTTERTKKLLQVGWGPFSAWVWRFTAGGELNRYLWYHSWQEKNHGAHTHEYGKVSLSVYNTGGGAYWESLSKDVRRGLL